MIILWIPLVVDILGISLGSFALHFTGKTSCYDSAKNLRTKTQRLSAPHRTPLPLHGQHALRTWSQEHHRRRNALDGVAANVRLSGGAEKSPMNDPCPMKNSSVP